jgi:DNA-binding transcriptional regulator/RsmH inhibitor MraZ
MRAPTLFERDIDLDGKLRLPDFMFDEYKECVISLGARGRHYLQLMPDGVYLMFLDGMASWDRGTPQLFDEELADIADRLMTAAKLTMDDTGRIQIPLEIINESDLRLGAAVIGQGSWVPDRLNEDHRPSYWKLLDKLEWLKNHPQGQYSLDSLGSRY